MIKSGAEIIYSSLLKYNVKTVFGYSGGAILPLTDMFYNSKIKYIMNRNEQCAGHAAEGFSKSSNKTGIVISTSGPGTTNLVTPLQDAYSDGVPLIAITGQVATDKIGTDAFQECPAIQLTSPCTKWSYQPQNVNELAHVMDKAFFIANYGRKGPVHIDIPKDLLTNKIEQRITSEKYYSNTIKLDLTKIENLLTLLGKANKPVIYAGQGCNNCIHELNDFIEKTNIPITTTIHGLGAYDENKELSLHMVGMHGSAYANKAIQESDLILAIGSRFDDRTTGEISKYAPEARLAELEERGGIVHFDISPTQLNKVIEPTIKFLGDCKHYLNYINSELKIRNFKRKYSNWKSEINVLKKENPFTYKKEKNNIKCPEILEEINKYAQKEKIFFTTGVGNHQMQTAQYIRWKYPKTMITSGSAGTMGFGLPSAIGVQCANPNSKVVCIDGDGSFMMTLNDLATIKEYNLPIKIFLMNNSRQQMVHIWQKLFFDERYISTDNLNPDFNNLATSFGIENLKIENKNDIIPAIELAMETDNPILVNCIVEPDMCTPLVAPGCSLDDMILEDTSQKLVGITPN